MMKSQQTGVKSLVHSLNKISQIQYNGKLNIEGAHGQRWSLYFRLGRIVWATGGKHPYRRWRRQITRYCPDINLSDIPLCSEDTILDTWDYILLTKLFEQDKFELKQINYFIETTIVEVLFDISQEHMLNEIKVEQFQSQVFDKPIHLASTSVCLKMMLEHRKNWEEAELASFSPNSAPIITKPEELSKILSSTAYTNFLNLVNGQYTLRDLTIKMEKSELLVASSLRPYILKGIVKLVELSDLPLKVNQSNKKSGAGKIPEENAPLIACIDDSPQVCQMMKKIILSRGLRFIGIADSIEALPILIKEKPSLIFLDLIMPVASGYEICAQLRRTSIFKNIPVIIVSANEGLVDRVRTKIIGANDFINKPIVTNKVLEVIDKYLHSQSSTAKNYKNV